VRHSLSVLLPVKNAQATLIDSVHEILDVVTDTKDPFEVIIIDDGSTDATGEVAHELTCHYPQVRMIRHPAPLGREAAIRTGLQRSQGQVIMLREHEGRFSIIEQRSDTSKPISSRPARPNYLSRIKGFALGE
jgi:dolichol-phosphate mannosyltransferase